MINGNGRPVSKKKQVQFMVALTILAWATQTLRHQWAIGSEATFAEALAEAHPVASRSTVSAASNDGDADDIVTARAASKAQPATPMGEKFVTVSGTSALPGTLELRSDATIAGSDVQLKQICRWPDSDQKTFAPLADFVIEHVKSAKPGVSISIDDLRRTLQDAGVNVAVIDFVGAAACKVNRSDAAADAVSTVVPTAQVASNTIPPGNGLWRGAADQGVTVNSQTPPAGDNQQCQNLRQKLIADCAARIHVAADELQIEFKPQDSHFLALSEPQFRFDVQSIRVRNLGDIAWSVTVLTDTGSQRVTIEATARAWQNQLVLARPLASRQVIRDDDCVERRTMVDSLSDDPLLTRSQLVGQQASRELPPGTVMTARMVQAVPMVRAGELVTITLTQGEVRVKTVGRALENGAFGESIRVRNEDTRDVYDVTMTGPQAADIIPGTTPK